MTIKLRKPTTEEDNALRTIFNAYSAELEPALKAHKDEILSTGMEFDNNNKVHCFFIVLDKDKRKDASDIPATVGPEKVPVKVRYVAPPDPL